MTPYHADPWLTVYQGDCRAVMAEMEPESVHCVVTSPPYWGLRDYGTATWVGGDEGCDHKPDFQPRSERPNVTGSGMGNGYAGQEPVFKDTCGKCGATRQDSQIGLEPTPEAYVENMVAVFREVRRVLRSDGTVWLNLGDSYARDPSKGGEGSNGKQEYNPAIQSARRIQSESRGSSDGKVGRGDRAALRVGAGLKPKDLVGIPWRVAFALQADGWYLRSDIIWAKPNPMPESVTDRPTKSHEYLFLLSKSPRYYYDADAVREAESPNTASFVKMKERFTGERHEVIAAAALSRKQDDVNDRRTTAGFYGPQKSTGFRNLRSVWSIATQPYPGAHFATFPPKLVEPCIKAGTSEKGVCPECGAPWVRIVERESLNDHGINKTPEHTRDGGEPRGPSDLTTRAISGISTTTTGWRPSCAHGDVDEQWLDPIDGGPRCYAVPATVLDPFAGSGTTGRVAQRLNRRSILIDLSAEYLKQAMDRNRDIPLGLGA
jgi:DNA modification methylase